MSLSHKEIIQELLTKKNTGEIPYISVEDLYRQKHNDFLVFDTREEAEYNVSHLPNAIHIGYENFDLKKFSKSVFKRFTNHSVLLFRCTLRTHRHSTSESRISICQQFIWWHIPMGRFCFSSF